MWSCPPPPTPHPPGERLRAHTRLQRAQLAREALRTPVVRGPAPAALFGACGRHRASGPIGNGSVRAGGAALPESSRSGEEPCPSH